MAAILLIGSDAALLEGLAQSLAAAGHTPHIAARVDEALELASAEPPLAAVVERAMATADAAGVLRLPLARGGALLLYRSSLDAEPTRPAALPAALGRAALADLTLPLERHRLAALISKVDARAHATGRVTRRTPPEQRAQ